ncbi:hypothetical protein NDU88_005586 [Pleurodeles waltl]|uniref:Uncharacterized protein n=1 Tax=Pleurodeles waltl TaxID=8319 RepID=A0AAV7M9R7_PLEWA|nr:hypothetical protein NDU88_005586 [Pleurodeles waltl]
MRSGAGGPADGLVRACKVPGGRTRRPVAVPEGVRLVNTQRDKAPCRINVPKAVTLRQQVERSPLQVWAGGHHEASVMPRGSPARRLLRLRSELVPAAARCEPERAREESARIPAALTV